MIAAKEATIVPQRYPKLRSKVPRGLVGIIIKQAKYRRCVSRAQLESTKPCSTYILKKKKILCTYIHRRSPTFVALVG